MIFSANSLFCLSHVARSFVVQSDSVNQQTVWQNAPNHGPLTVSTSSAWTCPHCRSRLKVRTRRRLQPETGVKSVYRSRVGATGIRTMFVEAITGASASRTSMDACEKSSRSHVCKVISAHSRSGARSAATRRRSSKPKISHRFQIRDSFRKPSKRS